MTMVSGGGDRRAAEIRRALSDGETALRRLKVSASSRSLARVALRVYKERDPERVLNSMGSLARDLKMVQGVVEEIYRRGCAAEKADAEAEPFGPAWMSYRQRLINDAETDADRVREWLDAWMEAIAVGRWAVARVVIGWIGRLPGGAELRNDLHLVTNDLGDGAVSPTVEPLDRILAHPELSPDTRVRLGVVKTRVLRGRPGGEADARRAAQRTVKAAAQAGARVQVLAHAAHIETLLDAADLERAARVRLNAPSVDPPVVDLVLADARLAQARGAYNRANELYDTAAEFGVQATQPHLLRDTPGNLFWAVARRLAAVGNAGALELYEEARSHGVVGRSEQPELKLILEQAEFLQALGRDAEAAATYRTAADLFSAKASPRAVDFYDKAHRLDPGNSELCWALGEELRYRATDADGAVDAAQLTRAIEYLEQARVLAGREVPGLLVSLGMAAHALRTEPDPQLWLERALMLDPTASQTAAMLAWQHSRDGYPLAAARTCDYAIKAGPADTFLAMQNILSLIDLRRFEQARKFLDFHVGKYGWNDELNLVLGWLTLRQDGPAAALKVLDSIETPSLDLTMARAAVLAASGDLESERSLLIELPDDPGLAGRPAALGWISYRLGDLDASVVQLDEAIARAPEVTVNGLNLAQVLLTRADPDAGDVGRATALLASCIPMVSNCDEVVQLAELELPQVLAQAGSPEVRDVVTEAIDLAHARLAELRRRERPSTLVSERLARARELRTGRIPAEAPALAEAMEIYAAVAHAGTVPEVTTVLWEVADELVAAGDRQVRAGRLDAAEAAWNRVLEVGRGVDPERPVPATLRARRGFSALERHGPQDAVAAEYLRASDLDSLRDAVDQFARTVSTGWVHHDRLLALAEETPGPERSDLIACANSLPLTRMYHLRRDDIAARDVSPVTRAVEVRFGGGHVDQRESPQLAAEIERIRRKIAQQFGVLIPGVKVGRSDDPEESGVTFYVHERQVAAIDVPLGEDPGPAAMVTFEQVVVENLARWLSIDDLDLWNREWRFRSRSSAAPLPGDLAVRTQLTHVLRGLLSEGIPIVDRRAILAGFRRSVGVATGPDELLASVRRELYPAICGVDPAQVQPLPADLERRLATGGARRRSDAQALLKDLRTWHRSARERSSADELSHPDAPLGVSVTESRLRLPLWRLLAAERPRVYVVSADELQSGAGRP